MRQPPLLFRPRSGDDYVCRLPVVSERGQPAADELDDVPSSVMVPTCRVVEAELERRQFRVHQQVFLPLTYRLELPH